MQVHKKKLIENQSFNLIILLKYKTNRYSYIIELIE